MVRKGVLTRNVTNKECPWLTYNHKKGEVVYEFDGYTYGCIGDGIAVSKKPSTNPFFEIPYDAIKWETE